jgi:sugar lactone lactonase YvrE
LRAPAAENLHSGHGRRDVGPGSRVCSSARPVPYAWDYDANSGAAGNRRTVSQFEPGAIPDGATVDEEGYLWAAVYEGAEVRRYAPDGTLDRVIPMPVKLPTSVMFGGTDLDILFVSSGGSEPIPGRVVPSSALGGALFAVRGLGVRGVPERRYGG